jgi:hypothetical protein
VIWHIVSLDMSAIEDDLRTEVERDLEGLRELDVVAWLAVARDVDSPSTTGLLTLFANYEDLETYREHPDHLPVVQRIRDLGIPITRLDVEAGVPPAGVDAR